MDAVDRDYGAKRLAACMECRDLVRERMVCGWCGCLVSKMTKDADAICPVGAW